MTNDRAKKILFIETQSEFGGAQRFIYTFVSGLKKHEIIVAAGIEGDDDKGLLKALDKIGINTRRLKYLRRGINPIFDFCFGVIEIYRLIKKEKPDVLFLCSSKAGAVGSFAGHLANVPKIIYRIGGWTFNDPWPKWKKKIFIFLEKWTARWKDIIIVNAECHRKQAIELGIKPRGEILTIYNGLDIGKLDFLPEEEARNRLKIQDSQVVIGTVANLYPAKGLEYLIEAASMIRNRFVAIKFIVMGEGMERKKLEELIKKHNLENIFFLVGAISDARKYLKAFNVFVLPSVKEGFPWVILEAMAAEVPIVATKVGALPEIIEDKKTALLVEPSDAKELSQAILTLLENYSFRISMAESAKKVVEEKFSLEKMVNEIEKLF
jgi:glycosyltransferase involved in cell wall biosynthesis